MKKRGMAIPLVLGLITVASILGISLTISGRAGANRVIHSQEVLQVSHLAEAGITEAFLRLKAILRKGTDPDQVVRSRFQLEVPVDRGTGACDVTIEPKGQGRFLLQSTGSFSPASGKGAVSRTCALQATVKVKVALEEDPVDPKRLIRFFRCRLSDLHRLAADEE